MYLCRFPSIFILFLLPLFAHTAASVIHLRSPETGEVSITKIGTLLDLLRASFLLNGPILRPLLPTLDVTKDGDVIVQEVILPAQNLTDLTISQRVALLQLHLKVAALFPRVAQVVENILKAVNGNALPLVESTLEGLTNRLLGSRHHEDDNVDDSVIGMVSNALDDILTTVFGDTSRSRQTYDYCDDPVFNAFLCPP
ncbi:hypothetical protein BJ165DRAFT_1402171 [Panaeolus papilionaceus]|nr:hypothetical protein BJ165DRAFT_1402171 [Panaeolus papilionaceus]